MQAASPRVYLARLVVYHFHDPYQPYSAPVAVSKAWVSTTRSGGIYLL